MHLQGGNHLIIPSIKIKASKNPIIRVSDEKQCSRRQQTAGPSNSELRIVAPGRPTL